MKKILLGLVIGIAVAVPTTTLAARTGLPDANVIYQFNCGGGSHCNNVAVFDDQDNKCYVSYDVYGSQSSISCVKR